MLAYKRAFFSFGPNDVELFTDFSIDVFSSLYNSWCLSTSKEEMYAARGLYDVVANMVFALASEPLPRKFLIDWLKRMADSGNAEAAFGYAAQIAYEINYVTDSYNIDRNNFNQDKNLCRQYSTAKKYYLRAWNDGKLPEAAVGLANLALEKTQNKNEQDELYQILLIAAKESSEVLHFLVRFSKIRQWKTDPLQIWIMQNVAILGLEPKLSKMDPYKCIMQSIGNLGTSAYVYCAAAVLSAIVDKDMPAAVKSLQFALAADSSIHEKYLAVGKEHGFCKDIHESTMKELIARINPVPVRPSRYFFRRPLQLNNLQVESKPNQDEPLRKQSP